MNNNSTTVVLGAITILVALLAIWVPYLNYISGPIPPKQLTADYSGPTDPLSDLTNTGANISVTVRSNNTPLTTIYVFNATLKNTGSAPILPADFFSDITLTAQAPWRIVAIGGPTIPPAKQVSVKWAKQSDTTYSAPPTLINPGDIISVTVYTTAPQDAVKALHYNSPSPIIWGMRVANLSAIITSPDVITQASNEMGPIYVSIWGWGVPTFLLVFSVYFSLHVTLLNRSNIIGDAGYIKTVVLTLIGLLSVTASEATNTYVFGTIPQFYYVDHWSNAPIVIANAFVLAGLYLLSIFRNRQRHGAEQCPP